MTALIANFRAFYQRRILWGMFAFIALFLFSQIALSGTFSDNILIVYVLIIFWFGCAIGSFAGDLWSVPLSFCLPGITRSSRKMFLIIVSTTVTVWCLLTIKMFSLVFLRGLPELIVLAGFYAMIMILGISISARSRLIGHFSSMMMLAIVFPLLATNAWDTAVTHIFSHPFLSAGICFAVSFLLYRFLGSRAFIRNHYGLMRFGCLDAWSVSAQKKRARYKEIIQGKKSSLRSIPLIDNFFTRRIAKTSLSPFTPHILGHTYLIIALTIISTKVFIPIILLISFLSLAFIAETKNFSALFFGSISVGASAGVLIQHSDILLPKSRRERLFSNIMSHAILLTGCLGLMGGFTLLSIWISAFAPPLKFFGKLHPFSSLNAEYLYFPVIIIPLVITWQTFFKKKERLARGVPVMGGIALFVGLQERISQLLDMLDCWSIIWAAVFSWCIYLAMVYYDNMKRSLC